MNTFDVPSDVPVVGNDSVRLLDREQRERRGDRAEMNRLVEDNRRLVAENATLRAALRETLDLVAALRPYAPRLNREGERRVPEMAGVSA